MNIQNLKKVLCAFDDFSMLFSWTRRHMKFLFAIRLFPWSYWVEKFLLWWQNNSRSKQMWEATHWAGVNLMDIIEPSFHFLRFQIKLNLISSHFGSRNMKSEFLATHDFFHWWKIWNHNIGFIPIRKPHTHTALEYPNPFVFYHNKKMNFWSIWTGLTFFGMTEFMRQRSNTEIKGRNFQSLNIRFVPLYRFNR